MDYGWMTVPLALAPMFVGMLFSVVWVALGRVDQSETFGFFARCVMLGGIGSAALCGLALGLEFGTGAGLLGFTVSAITVVSVWLAWTGAKRVVDSASERVARRDKTGEQRERNGRILLAICLLMLAYTAALKILGIE